MRTNICDIIFFFYRREKNNQLIIYGISISRSAPSIFHILFVDNNIMRNVREGEKERTYLRDLRTMSRWRDKKRGLREGDNMKMKKRDAWHPSVSEEIGEIVWRGREETRGLRESIIEKHMRSLKKRGIQGLQQCLFGLMKFEFSKYSTQT